jgi:4-amino-4-deoxy-L-arabinose transferase-like glycosyltransferase
MAAIDDSLRGKITFDGTRTPTKTALFLVVVFAWLLPGLVGHDPWKYDEAIVFGIVTEMLRTGDWVAFHLAGEPYLDKAPLFIWVAALLAKVLGPVMPLHDAARLAAGLFMGATLAFLSAASLELRGGLRLAVLLFIGTLGLLPHAHEMTTDLAGLMGVALGLYGLVLAARRPRLGGALIGAGIGLGFLGDAFLPAGVLLATLAVLPAVSPFWRTREYATTVGIALACAAPLLAIWPLTLASLGPDALRLWLGNAAANRWNEPLGTQTISDMFYFTRILPWYAWPAWPLAAWAIYRGRHVLPQRRDLMLPLLAFATFYVVTSVFGESRVSNGLIMLLPLALLGAAELDTLPRGAASALDWFGMMTFLSLGAAIWLGYVAAITGRPESIAEAVAREVPGFRYPFSFVAFALASLLTLIWVVVVARSLRTTRRALVNWTAGITMVWMLVMTLGLPLVDQAKGYRAVDARIAAQLSPNAPTCIARRNVGDPQRALLDYFAGIRTVREDDPASTRCDALLVQTQPLKSPPVDPAWKETWRGSRPGDRSEQFILYRR